MKQFVTLFPAAENVHLLKDVGIIPYIMHRDYGYESKLVCFHNSDTYQALADEVNGLKIEFIDAEPYQFGKVSKHVLSYLRNNAKQIDILNLYHHTTESMVYALAYRLFNPKGIVYIKLDISIQKFDKQQKQWFHPLRLIGYNLFFKYITQLVTCEIPTAQTYLEKAIPALKGKLILLTNGIDTLPMEQIGLHRNTFQEKENIFLTVGRIGAQEKNHELLLQSLTNMDLKDWKVVFVGPIAPAFTTYLTAYFAQHPHLKEQIIFTGNISNRTALYSWYNRAKVFCLTSRFESFGIVLAEALYFGNYILSTGVESIQYITDNERLGKTINSSQELAILMDNIITEKIDISAYYHAIVAHAEKFRWSENLQPVDERIQQIVNKQS
jgi:glycosyltransferase involved in cell wall biosynthesis